MRSRRGGGSSSLIPVLLNRQGRQARQEIQGKKVQGLPAVAHYYWCATGSHFPLPVYTFPDYSTVN